MTQVAEAYSLLLGQSNVALTGNLTTWKMEKTETTKMASVQGDHSACAKPPVDIDMKVAF